MWKYIQRHSHQTNDKSNDCSNTGIYNYPVWSRNMDNQKGSEGNN